MINDNERPTREECARDESNRPPFIWRPTAEELKEAAEQDPWNRQPVTR
jgi:hypothetical protein